jgi:hypothetical protein
MRVHGYARLSVNYCGKLIKDHIATSTYLDFSEESCALPRLARIPIESSFLRVAASGNSVKGSRGITSQ